MKFQGAIIKEQGVTFAVVIVKKSIMDDRSSSENAIKSFQTAFPAIPIVLMAQDHKGSPTYYGRRDISKFMASVPLSAVRWKEFTLR